MVIWGFAALSIFSFISLILFIVHTNLNYSIIFRTGFLIFEVIVCINVIKNYFSVKNIEKERDIYKKLAYVDMLTQLGSRTAFEEDVEILNKEFNSKGKQILTAVFDINGLKKYNDSYGHKAGDAMIQGTASIIKDSFENYGKYYRIGGDEFCVIMLDADINTVQKCFDELNEKTEK